MIDRSHPVRIDAEQLPQDFSLMRIFGQRERFVPVWVLHRMEGEIRRAFQRRELVEYEREKVIGLSVFLILVIGSGGEIHESILRTVLFRETRLVSLKIFLRRGILSVVVHPAHELK